MYWELNTYTYEWLIILKWCLKMKETYVFFALKYQIVGKVCHKTIHTYD